MEFGKIEYLCAERQNGNGKGYRTLLLTLVGQGDEALLLQKGLRELRLKRIMRITDEAAEQGCLLGYDDLEGLLLTSLATLKRDIACLESRGQTVRLKGRRKNGNGVAKAAGKKEGNETGELAVGTMEGMQG